MLLTGPSPLAGADCPHLYPAVAEELSCRGRPPGVIVGAVEAGSTAEDAGVRAGDVIVDVNGKSIDTTRHLAEATTTRVRVSRHVERDGGLLRQRLQGWEQLQHRSAVDTSLSFRP